MQETDGTEATAPLRVVPGSHRDYSTVPEDLADPSARWAEREHLVSAPAGSVVFTHNGILHSGSHNSRPDTRYFVSCYINRLGLPVRDVQQGALVEAKLAQARARRDLRIIRLLGQEEDCKRSSSLPLCLRSLERGCCAQGWKRRRRCGRVSWRWSGPPGSKCSEWRQRSQILH